MRDLKKILISIHSCNRIWIKVKDNLTELQILNWMALNNKSHITLNLYEAENTKNSKKYDTNLTKY